MTDHPATPTTPTGLDILLAQAGSSLDAVPEFLWYDLAVAALGPEAAPASRETALRMLAKVPRSWDAVVTVALSGGDQATQLEAIQTLRAHVEAEPARLEAFEALGELAAWWPAARKAWKAARREILDAHETARREQMIAQLKAQATMLMDTVEHLSSENSDFREAVAQAGKAEREALERIGSLEATMATEVARLETAVGTEKRLRANEAAIYQSERLALESARVAAVAGRKRWAVAAAVGMSAAVLPLLMLASGRLPVMASEPPRAGMKAATAEGFSQAEIALAGEAARLEVAGDARAAQVVWRALAAIARDSSIATHARKQAEGIATRGRTAGRPAAAAPTAGSAAARPARPGAEAFPIKPRPHAMTPAAELRAAVAAVHASTTPARGVVAPAAAAAAIAVRKKPVVRSLARPVPPSTRFGGAAPVPAPPAAAGPSDGIPDAVRAKF